MMKTLWQRLLAVLVLVFSANILLAQLSTAVNPGPVTGHRATYTQREEASARERMQRSAYSSPIISPPETDEYGYFNFNGILSLGTAGGYVAIANPYNENVDGSIEAWIYPTDTSIVSAPCIVGQGDSTAVGFYFGEFSGTHQLFIRFGNSATINADGDTIPQNQWTHVACTWSGGAGNYAVKFYVNGAQSGSPDTNAGSWTVSSDSMTIGNSLAPFGGKAFYGFIDEVRYWEDERTAAEIAGNRFVGIGDGSSANTAGALTSAASYVGLNASYNFNVGASAPDFVGGFNGVFRNVFGAIYSNYASQPMPYNFALNCPYGATDFVEVPDNAVFNLSSAGTAEAWVYPTGQTTTHMILSRGTTGFELFYGIRASIGNRAVLDINSVQFQDTGGVVIPLNMWSHVAATWVQAAGNYTVTFYVNGKRSSSPQTKAATWGSTSGTLRIGGWHGGTTNNWNGKLDEVRIWNAAKTEADVQQYMFVSGRTLSSDPTLVGIWNFDGNLQNFSSTTGINGTFSTGGTNNCRLSAFTNESTTGPMSRSFEAYATVVNRFATGNPFPEGFRIRVPGKSIHDNSSTFDTLSVPTNAPLTAVEAFMSIRHTYCGDLTITLTAPNGQSRILTDGNGGTGRDMLTFFLDGATPVTTANFYAPWTHIAGPEAALGTFGSGNTQGNWILEVHDGATADTGVVTGWGLRFNNQLTTGVEPVSGTTPQTFELQQNYPNPFNPSTTIRYQLGSRSHVTLVVYDVLGREVTTLVNGIQEAGAQSVRFNASDVSSGVYFFHIKAGDFVSVKKMMVLK